MKYLGRLRQLTDTDWWNVEYFAAPGGGGIEAPPQEVFDAKLRFLGERIRQIDPDLVALQEIGNEEAFEVLSQ